MVQAVSRRCVDAESPGQYQVSPCAVFGGQSGNATGFSQSISVFPCQMHSTNAPHSSSSTLCSYRKENGRSLETCEKSDAVSEVGELWIDT